MQGTETVIVCKPKKTRFNALDSDKHTLFAREWCRLQWLVVIDRLIMNKFLREKSDKEPYSASRKQQSVVKNGHRLQPSRPSRGGNGAALGPEPPSQYHPGRYGRHRKYLAGAGPVGVANRGCGRNSSFNSHSSAVIISIAISPPTRHQHLPALLIYQLGRFFFLFLDHRSAHSIADTLARSGCFAPDVLWL